MSIFNKFLLTLTSLIFSLLSLPQIEATPEDSAPTIFADDPRTKASEALAKYRSEPNDVNKNAASDALHNEYIGVITQPLPADPEQRKIWYQNVVQAVEAKNIIDSSDNAGKVQVIDLNHRYVESDFQTQKDKVLAEIEHRPINLIPRLCPMAICALAQIPGKRCKIQYPPVVGPGECPNLCGALVCEDRDGDGDACSQRFCPMTAIAVDCTNEQLKEVTSEDGCCKSFLCERVNPPDSGCLEKTLDDGQKITLCPAQTVPAPPSESNGSALAQVTPTESNGPVLAPVAPTESSGPVPAPVPPTESNGPVPAPVAPIETGSPVPPTESNGPVLAPAAPIETGAPVPPADFPTPNASGSGAPVPPSEPPMPSPSGKSCCACVYQENQSTLCGVLSTPESCISGGSPEEASAEWTCVWDNQDKKCVNLHQLNCTQYLETKQCDWEQAVPSSSYDLSSVTIPWPNDCTSKVTVDYMGHGHADMCGSYYALLSNAVNANPGCSDFTVDSYACSIFGDIASVKSLGETMCFPGKKCTISGNTQTSFTGGGPNGEDPTSTTRYTVCIEDNVVTFTLPDCRAEGSDCNGGLYGQGYECKLPNGSSANQKCCYKWEIVPGPPTFDANGNIVPSGDGVIGTGPFWSAPGTQCQTFCGNGIPEKDEQCDPGYTHLGDPPKFSCSKTCKAYMPGCGNNYLDFAEACDDGNTANGDGCSSLCHKEECGNGRLDYGEECDMGSAHHGPPPAYCSSSCRMYMPLCGNSIQDSTEQCDDGNLLDGDGCSSTCMIGH